MPDTTRQERWAERFSIPMIVAALLVVPALVIEESGSADAGLRNVADVMNWVIWVAFAAEFLVLLALAPDRRAWLRRHPLDAAILILTPPFGPAAIQGARALRLLRVVRLFRLERLARELTTPEGLTYAAVTTVVVVLASGTGFTAVEAHHHGATDVDLWDGIWWAINTVTTVGYGDLYPVTTAGRALAIVVMGTGIGFVALLTASFAQTVIARRGGPSAGAEHAEVLERLDALMSEVTALRTTVRELESRNPGEGG